MVTRQKSKNTDNALLSDAMEILMEHLGPEKTGRLWSVIAPAKKDYLSIRAKLFKGKSGAELDKKISKFNLRK